MDENIFKYGSYDVDKGTLLKSLQHENNIRSFSRHKRYTPEQESEFRNIVYYLQNGIKNNTISGTGFGKFTDVSETPMEYSEIYGDALNYVHQIANTIGDSKPKQKIVEEKESGVEAFDRNKHGFGNYFVQAIAPFASNEKDLEDAIKAYRSNLSLQQLGEKFAEDISKWQEFNNNFENLDFTKYSTSAELFNQGIEQFKAGISDGVIDDNDRSLAHKLGLSNQLNVVFGVNTPQIIKSESEQESELEQEQEQEQEKPLNTISNEDISDLSNLGWTINAQNKWVTPDGKVTFFDAKEHPLQSISNLSFGNYLNENYIENSDRSRKQSTTGDIENTGIKSWYNALGESDKFRLQSIGYDLFSIIWPTPAIAAGAGYTSDWLQYQADKLDGSVDLGKTLGNVALSTVGSIPVIGDSGMLAKTIIKLKKSLPIIAGVLTLPGIAYAVNNPDMYKDVFDKIANHPKDLTVDDMRSIYDLLTYAMGGLNMSKRIGSKQKANKIYDEAQDALSITVKSKSKGNKDIHITDEQGIRQLNQLKDDPVAFKKYLQDNYEGLDDIELATVKNKTKLELTKEKESKIPSIKRKVISGLGINS